MSRAISGAASGASAGNKIVPGVGGIVGGIGGFLGGLFGGGGPSPEEIAAQELQDAWNGTIVLSPEERMIRLEMLKDMGRITPEMEAEILQQDTQLKGLRVDPKLKAQQVDALQRLSQQGREGLNLEDRVALEEIQRAEAQANRGQQEAILQNMEARGMGGAGAELAARLQASQSSADRASQRGLSVAAQAQQRALQAMMQSGEMAGRMGQQDYENQAQVGTAQDAINRFNTGSRQDVQSANIRAKNEAQEANLNYAKQLEANRVATANAQRTADAAARAAYVQDANTKKIKAAEAKTGVASATSAREARDDEGFQGMMSGIGSVAGQVGPVSKWEMPDWLKKDASGSSGRISDNQRGPASKRTLE